MILKCEHQMLPLNDKDKDKINSRICLMSNKQSLVIWVGTTLFWKLIRESLLCLPDLYQKTPRPKIQKSMLKIPWMQRSKIKARVSR